MDDQNQQGGGAPQQPRPKFQGDWTCSKCGGKITELPFDPDPLEPAFVQGLPPRTERCDGKVGAKAYSIEPIVRTAPHLSRGL